MFPGVPRVTQLGRLLARGRPDEGTRIPILSLVLHSDIGDGDRRVLVARIDSFCVKLRLHRRPAQAAHLRCESELSWDARGSGGLSIATAEAACTGVSVTCRRRQRS